MKAAFHGSSYSQSRKIGAQLIHWISSGAGIACEVMMPDRSIKRGFVEKSILQFKVGDIVQFQRFGYVKIDRMDEAVVVCWTHK